MDKGHLIKCFNVFDLASKEVRAIEKIPNCKSKIYCGHFTNVVNLIEAIEANDKPNLNWYFVFNAIKPDTLQGKEHHNGNAERLVVCKEAIADGDILRRRWVMLDFDPVRKSGTSSTDEQLEKACCVAKKVWEFLFHNGFYDFVGCFSGNGYHIMLPCDMACDEDSDVLVKDFLQVISMLFSTEEVEIDTAVHNRARLTKLYGTVAHKGENTEGTPHRLSCIRHCPKVIRPIAREYFEKVVSCFKTPVKSAEKYNNFGKSSSFDVKRFLDEHNIGYSVKSIAGGTKYILNECVFNSEHKKPDSAVFQFSDGSLGFKCFHNSCSSYHWKEFRQKLEPFSEQKREFSSKDYNEFVQERIDVDNEWIDFDMIECEQADNILRIPSGFKALDSCLLGGFASGGISILTGVNGCGKTVFLKNMILNMCDGGFKVGLFSGEMQQWRIKTWIRMIARGLHVDNKENNELIDQSLKNNLFVYNNSFGNEWGHLFESVRAVVDSKEINLVILDNLACMRLNPNKGEKFDQQSSFIKELADYARQRSIHVILVAHPRKSFGVVRKEDIAGTYDLSNMADNVLIMHKVNEDFRKHAKEFFRKDMLDLYFGYDSLVEVAKNRDAGEERVIGLFYENYSKRLKNSFAETLHFKWEEGIISNHLISI